jgi:UDP-N-acetyl-D-mannosaminuronic acid dehydrogenase
MATGARLTPGGADGSGSIAIVGGCGHVGLPLGLVFADAGHAVTLYDREARSVEQVQGGNMPFFEDGAAELLARVLASGALRASSDPGSVSAAEHVVVVIGTPVDEYMNPKPEFVLTAVEDLLGHLRDGQHLILRSTVYPGVTAMIERLISASGLAIDVSFCPERIAEGRALVELRDLPQIVSARTEPAAKRAEALFAGIAKSIVRLEVEEAELAKLFTNTWRYVKFAAANQLYMIANDFGLDFSRIRDAITFDYPRAADLPGAGLAAGPCLLKDTMQLAAFNKNNFTLGHASMMINEGLPMYIVDRLERQYDLASMTVGILGTSFKAESDDIRSSLSYKLKRLLRIKSAKLLCTDPYVTVDPGLVPLEEVLANADLLVIATPHRVYADIEVEVPVVDIWNLRGFGDRV